MPIGFNPLMGQSRLLDIIDQLLAGSGTSATADMPDLSPTDMSQRVNLSNPAPTNPNPMAGLFQPQTRATDAYLNLLSQFPQRTEPGPGRKVLASLAGLGTAKPLGITGGQVVGFQGGSPEEAFQAEDLVRYRPFYQQLQDWQAKAKPFEAAAVNEKNYNQNMRQLLYDIARTGNQATAIENRKENEAAKRDLDWYKTQIDWYKAQNFDFGYNDKGEAVAKDKRTGEQKVILNPDGTPAKTGDLEKVRMQGEFAQKRAETMAGAAIQRVKVAGKYRNWQQITDKDTGEVWLVEPGTTKAIKPTPDMFEEDTTAPQVSAPATTPGVTPPTQKPVQKPPTFISKPTQTKQPANLAAIQQTTQDTLQALDELLGPDNKLRPEIGKYVGLGRISGFIEKYIPGAEARTTQAKIDRLRNLLSIELIGEMKTQSRTGATGFGQLSTRELEVLEKAASKLDPGIEKEAFQSELIRIKERLRKILMGPGGPDVKRTPDELYEMYRKDKK